MDDPAGLAEAIAKAKLCMESAYVSPYAIKRRKDLGKIATILAARPYSSRRN